MSRLDSFIARMSAQRDLLDHVRLTGLVPDNGLILEIGLGNGRTYHHLREYFPASRIVAFDRAIGSHPASTPPQDDLVLGEISETIGRFAGGNAVLAHADIGTAYPEVDAQTLTWLPGAVADALQAGGVAVSGLPLEHEALEALPVPASIPAGRYFLYRKR